MSAEETILWRLGHIELLLLIQILGITFLTTMAFVRTYMKK
jgi:hypothetical protein